MNLYIMLKKANAQNSDNKGFTILELLIVMAIIAILGVAIISFFTNISEKSTVERTISTTQQKARLALEIMARDIRMAGLDPTDSGSAGIWDPRGSTPSLNATQTDATTADFFSFSADLNYDGDVDDPYERIAYYIDSAGNLTMETFELISGTVTPVQLPMLTGLQAGDLQFKYFNANGAEITPPENAANNNGSNLFSVEITLNVRTDTINGEIKRSYSTMVRLRNQ